MKRLLLKIVDMLNLYPLFNRYTRNSAAIFMLHNFTDENVITYEIATSSQLEEYLGYLKRNKYNVLSLDEYVDALVNHKDTYKAIVFTVDDGFRDFYQYAFPVFKKHGYPATIFLTSDFIEGTLFFWWNRIEYTIANTKLEELDPGFTDGRRFELGTAEQKKKAAADIVAHCKKLPTEKREAYIDNLIPRLDVDISDQPKGKYAPLNWDEIQEMYENGINFHPHTKTHPIMERTTPEQQHQEADYSRRYITEKLGSTADIFCYPNGGWTDFTDETISILESLGYKAAVVGGPGFCDTKKDNDVFRIPRLSIPISPIIFKQYVCGLENLKYGIRK